MTIASIAAIALLGLISGVMIGCIGIGGIILVPALTYLFGISIQTAIAAAMMAYVLSGVLASFVFVREQADRKSAAIWLWVGAMPAALAGAWAANRLHPAFLEVAIGLLILFSGFHSLRGGAQAELEDRHLGNGTMTALGGLTGVISAITGTGGPLVLVPMLMWMRQPVLMAIRLGQSVQLPVALLATLGNFLYGEPDLLLGVILMVGVTAGSVVGTRLSQVLPRTVLRHIVSLALVVIGFAIFIKVASRFALF